MLKFVARLTPAQWSQVNATPPETTHTTGSDHHDPPADLRGFTCSGLYQEGQGTLLIVQFARLHSSGQYRTWDARSIFPYHHKGKDCLEMADQLTRAAQTSRQTAEVLDLCRDPQVEAIWSQADDLVIQAQALRRDYYLD